ncbi:MAG: hypothetical protein JWN99_1177 [Ilumatobacteraceae bacterium]|nr:hypothetical protein [Ilumatobacteraceae bacterium]
MTAPTPNGWQIVELTTEQTHALRLAVLRAGMQSKQIVFAEDDWPGVRHLGITDEDVLIATSTWIPRPLATEPDVPAVQLRGMATAASHQSQGVGAVLLNAGCEAAARDGAGLVWANARDAATAFYVRNGFRVVGDGFVDVTTQLPHHVVVRRLV